MIVAPSWNLGARGGSHPPNTTNGLHDLILAIPTTGPFTSPHQQKFQFHVNIWSEFLSD
jgi:hypothetical protein